jgi:hypothetical protein
MPQIRGTHKLVLFFKNREFKVVRVMLRVYFNRTLVVILNMNVYLHFSLALIILPLLSICALLSHLPLILATRH